MFDVGPFELLALAVLALFVFGPDKLPKLAADAGRMLRQLRDMARNAREELGGSLGSEFGDLGLKDLDPREFVKRQLLDESADIDTTIKDVQQALNREPSPNGSVPAAQNGSTSSPGNAQPQAAAAESRLRDDGDAT